MRKAVLLFVFYITCVVISYAQTLPYCLNSTPVNFTSTLTASPSRMLVADFNGDGKEDIATANLFSNSISILLATGVNTGSFMPAVNYSLAVGSRPSSITSGDFNNDGNVDLAITNSGLDRVSIFIGSGNGSFIYTSDHLVNNDPFSIVAADFNGDGNTDLVVANRTSYNISVLIGLGNGAFAIAVNYITNGSPSALLVNDFNGDANPDIAVANDASAGVSILLGSGTGVFSAAINYGPAGGGSKIFSKDFNGDAIIDLAVLSQQGASILVGIGDGSFAAAITCTISDTPTSMSVGDFNNDGVNDIVFPVAGPTTYLSTFIGTGVGTFSTGANYDLNYEPGYINEGDFNDDGNLDLAIINETTNFNLSILLGIGNGNFLKPDDYSIRPGGAGPIAISSADFDGDGIIDLATANRVSHNVSVLKGLGNGIFSAATNYSVGTKPISLTRADFNNDGYPDLATANEVSDNISVIMGSATGMFSAPTNYSIGADPAAITSADFNGDGKTDIAVTAPSSTSMPHILRVLLNSGLGTFSAAVNYTVPFGLQSITQGDFNNDGNIDLVAGSLTGHVISFLGSSNGTFVNSADLHLTPGVSSLSEKDLNNDNILDLAVTNSYKDCVYILIGNGNGSFFKSASYKVKTNPKGVVLGDFNHDAIADMAVANAGATEFSILIGTGNGFFAPSISHDIGAASSGLTVNDFNGDGSDDLALIHEFKDNISIIINGIPSVSIIGPDTLCLNNNAILVANGASVYNWSLSGATTNTVVINQFNTTTYTVTGTTIYGCANIATKTISVSVLSLPTITVNSGTVCSGSSFTITPTGAISYTYSTVNPIITPLSTSNFTVIGEGSNGCYGTAFGSVTVNASPQINLTSSDTVCINSSVSFSVSGVGSYTWSSGSIGTTTNISPTSTAIYSLSVYDNNGCTDLKNFNLVVDSNCQDVWPGDANSDGMADNLDVLELGLHYTQTGPARSTTSNNWQSYFANNWSGTITNGKNRSHSDCNGDGTVNDGDTLAIYNNYGLTHAFRTGQANMLNPELSIVPDQPAVVKGAWGTASIYLGDASNPQTYVNGIAFTIDFDNTLIETNNIYVEYENSFLNLSGQNLNFRKLVFGNGKIYTATTHTNNTNVSGHGKIATLHYQIKSTLTADQVLNVGLSQANQSSAIGNITPLTSGTATLMAMGATVGVNELSTGSLINISPNPAQSVVSINSTTNVEKLEVINLTGQVLISESAEGKTHHLNTGDLANGVYFIKAYNSSKQVVLKKLVIQK